MRSRTRGCGVGRALKWGVNEVRIRQRAGGGVSLELGAHHDRNSQGDRWSEGRCLRRRIAVGKAADTL